MATAIIRKPAVTLEPDPEAINLVIPCGIGDASWVYSKVKHFPSIFGRPVVIAMPGAEPQRGHQLIERLPNVRWGGYEKSWQHDQIFRNAIPGYAPKEAFTPGVWHSIECNRWLEWGKPLEKWFPWCPTDYHYDIRIEPEETVAAGMLLASLPGPVWSIYVSNRDKENYPGWTIWTAEEWEWILSRLPGSFVFLGAEYDRDKTEDVQQRMQQLGRKTALCLGQSLGVALACLKSSDRFLAYPSGIGILANVLRTPGVMLLSKPLPGLEQSFGDPEDLESGRYRAWVCPTKEEALTHLKNMDPKSDPDWWKELALKCGM